MHWRFLSGQNWLFLSDPEWLFQPGANKPAITKEPVASKTPEIRIETSSFKIYVTNGIDEQTLRMVLRVTADA